MNDAPSLPDLLRCARGEAPADLLLEDARVVLLETGEIVSGSLAILGSRIVGIGAYEAREVLDLGGAFVAPGFIDAHVHIESSMVPPAEFARAVLPRGTTTVLADPHEIANVFGLDGVRFMLDDAERSPLSVLVMAPSCVPASGMETSGADLGAAELALLLEHPRVHGLAEMMNYQGVVAGEEGVLEKLRVFSGRTIDGHCPGLGGKELAAYACAGIGSDHECTTAEEAREKLRCGMTVFLREASAARNLGDLLPAVTPENHHRLCLCTDDRQPVHLLEEGHIDSMLRATIAAGIVPVHALRMASANAALHFGLRDRGRIAPGCRADLVVFDDLDRPRPSRVFAGGRLVARDGAMRTPRSGATASLPKSVHVDWSGVDLAVPAAGRRVRVIGVVPGQLRTEHLIEEAAQRDGLAVADAGRDLAKMVVVERHGRGGTVGKGFVRGLGLRRGAIASTIAHDHHNLVVAGADDTSMMAAARRVVELGGGLVVARGETVRAELPLPLAGLMSDRPIEEVRARLVDCLREARELGSALADPFMTLSFLALEVIPSLKLTDRGLVDVERFEIVPLWAD